MAPRVASAATDDRRARRSACVAFDFCSGPWRRPFCCRRYLGAATGRSRPSSCRTPSCLPPRRERASDWPVHSFAANGTAMAAPDPTPFPLDHLALRGERDAPALIADGRTISFAELDEDVGRVAAALLAAGLTPGDRIASWMGKTRLAC